MPRVFVDEPLSIGQPVVIGGEDGHHFCRVLRAKPGEKMALATGGQAFLATIQAVDTANGQVTAWIEHLLPTHEPSVRVVLVQGLAKGDKIEDILQKCTEAGASDFMVVAAARSVVQLDAKKAAAKVARWERLLREAAGQSQRDLVPNIAFAANWSVVERLFGDLQPNLVLLLDEDESAVGLRERLVGVRDGDGSSSVVIALLVGPEGGWDAEERRWLKEHLGAQTITLGPRILRTETAGLAALSAVLYEFGDLGGR